MKTQISSIYPEIRDRSRKPKHVACLAALFAITLLTLSSAVLRAQSVAFAGAQTTLPISGLNNPYGAVLDRAGDLFITDSHNNRVLEVTPAGVQSIVPTNGLNYPAGVALDGAGDLFIVDNGNNRVVELPWTVNGYGAQITVVASLPDAAYGIAVDGKGDLFIAVLNGSPGVMELPWTGSGYGPQTTVYNSGAPIAVAVDAAGDVFVSDAEYGRVMEVPWSESGYGAPIMVSSGPIDPVGLSVDGAGDIFVGNGVNDGVANGPVDESLVEIPWTGSGYGAQITVASGFDLPYSVAVNGAGDVFVTDYENNRIVEVQTQSVNFGSANICPSGQASPAPCSQAATLTYNITADGSLGAPNVLTQGTPNLDFTLASGNTCAGAVTAGSTCTVNVTFAPKAPGARKGAVQLTDNSGNVLATTPVYGQGQGAQIAYGPGTPITLPVGSATAYAVTTDAAGNVYSVNLPSASIVKIPAGGGAPTTVATPGVPPTAIDSIFSLAVDGAGDVFFSTSFEFRVYEVTPAGVVSIVPIAGLVNPQGVAVDGAGNLYVSDTGDGDVVKFSPTGNQTTLATGFFGLNGIAVDQAGDVFVADVGNNRVVEVPASGGSQITVASGLSNPWGVAVDAAGDLFIGDYGNQRVVELQAGGRNLITIAGALQGPTGVAVDGAGNVFIALFTSNLNNLVEVPRSAPPSLSFASTPVGQTSSDSPKSFTIENIGNQPLNAIAPGLSIGANFAQVSGSGTPEDCTGSFSLTPGASCNLSISFEPTTFGTINSSVVLTDNALNSNPATQSVPLSGTGTQTNQTITFNPIASNQAQGASLTLSAKSSSGLAVSFNSLTPSICTVSGTTATLSGSGTCTIQAMQAGNTNYLAATPVLQSFTVLPSFTITPIPGSETIKRGVLAGFILQLNGGKGFSGNVKLTCSGGPVGAQCADLPMTVKLTSNGVAYAVSGILFPAKTAPGTYTMTFTGVSGSITETTTATFTVTQ